jgi:hypothetical protein
MILNVETAVDCVNSIIPKLADQPTEPKEGRGVVISAGGAKFQINAYICIRMLRELGCQLPIQCWYLGPAERNEAWERIVAAYDVECIDSHEVRKTHPHARLHGWENKPYAIQHSPFAEVLYLDADNVPVRDPTYLFEAPEYKEAGTVFWPDYSRLAADRSAWKVFGDIPYRNEPEVESGQILIDKLRCWKALELCHWYMQNSNNFYFHHVHGDKEVFHLAWRKLEIPYAMPGKGIHSLPGVMCQHDFTSNRVFQHRNLRKWTFHKNPTTPGFVHEEKCLEFLQTLRAVWWPAWGGPATDDDKVVIQKLAAQVFTYL